MKIAEITDAKNLKFFIPDSSVTDELPFALSRIPAGFPSPAADYTEEKLDLNTLVVKNRSSTFYAQVEGKSLNDADLYEGDILVIDKSLQPAQNNLVVAYIDGEFTAKVISHVGNKIYLMPRNKAYKPIEITDTMNFQVWGIVTYMIKKTYPYVRNC